MTATGRLTLAQLRPEDLDPLVGGELRFELAPGVELTTELVEVSRIAHGLPGGRAPFSVLFRSRLAPNEGSGLWVPRHDSFEPEPWFVNRIFMPGAEPGYAYFEASFA